MIEPTIQTHPTPDGFVVLTIDQPGSRANVLSAQLWTELESASEVLAARAELQGLVIAAAKPGIFIAGADLKFLQQASAPNDPGVRAFIEHGLRVLYALESLPFPTCAAIDGAALGGGMEVALACDYRLAGTNPRMELGLPEVKLGLIPGWGGTQRLPRIASTPTAAEMLRTGASLKADAAHAAGLVEKIVDSAALIDAAIESIREHGDDWQWMRTRKASPLPEAERGVPALTPDASTAVREGHECLTRGVELNLKDAIKLETDAFQRLAGSEESKRLIAEFFAARKK